MTLPAKVIVLPSQASAIACRSEPAALSELSVTTAFVTQVDDDPTVSVAVLLVEPIPLSFDMIGPVVLFFTPAVMPCTLTEIVQLLFAASVPLRRPTAFDPSGGKTVPPHVLLRFPGVATSNPSGKRSEKKMPFSEVALG